MDTQIRAFREMHVRELREAAERLAAIEKLQADELQLIVDELADILRDAEDPAVRGGTHASVDGTPEATRAPDPAAASPKRAKWLAEQERRAHFTRRDLLAGRDDR